MTTYFNMKKYFIPILAKFDYAYIVNKVSEHPSFHFGRLHITPKKIALFCQSTEVWEFWEQAFKHNIGSLSLSSVIALFGVPKETL